MWWHLWFAGIMLAWLQCLHILTKISIHLIALGIVKQLWILIFFLSIEWSDSLSIGVHTLSAYHIVVVTYDWCVMTFPCINLLLSFLDGLYQHVIDINNLTHKVFSFQSHLFRLLVSCLQNFQLLLDTSNLLLKGS